MRDRLQALLTHPVVQVPIRIAGRIGCRHHDDDQVVIRLKGRMVLRCTCGRETAGIVVEPPPLKGQEDAS